MRVSSELHTIPTGSLAMHRTTHSSRRRSVGFSLTDLLVVMAVIAVMLALQLPTQASARKSAQRMENSAQLRGIQQSMITFSNSNGDQGPGMDNKGRILADSAKQTGNSGDGDTVEARFYILLDGDYFTPDYIISPSENSGVQRYQEGRFNAPPVPVVFDEKGKRNYSYAMLRILKGNVIQNAPAPRPHAIAGSDLPRALEWSSGLNSQAVIASDRNTGSNATNGAKSIHTKKHGNWAGSVVWGDGHAGYETEQYLETKYGNGNLNRPEGRGFADNLFDDQNIGVNADGPAGSNALMVVDGNNGVFSNDAGRD